ncbi:hypothetical protein BMT55_13870 [Listeria newyorkensis]|uniref:Uncharacterized protein n=1 Tax=Listeria newyorkensis TaxID=1497681 RepID=A0ABX4XQ74_9LIST|nr:hypothetical protein [Listeria newyorkensis]PNP88954.1 hypothetical protein BMT55_13870 [Listeria newyorkensis]WAO22070.1 hypothetical protein OTR81_01900 [Listeria newyorkensis]
MKTKFDDLIDYISLEVEGMENELDSIRLAANQDVDTFDEEMITADELTGDFVRLEDYEALKESVDDLLIAFDMRGVN